MLLQPHDWPTESEHLKKNKECAHFIEQTCHFSYSRVALNFRVLNNKVREAEECQT